MYFLYVCLVIFFFKPVELLRTSLSGTVFSFQLPVKVASEHSEKPMRTTDNNNDDSHNHNHNDKSNLYITIQHQQYPCSAVHSNYAYIHGHT